MKRVRLIASAATMAILGAFAAGVDAQNPNTQDRTYLTFSSAVEMPGVILQPGTYEFQLADTQGRNVVQVFTKDRTEVIGQWTFVQSQRERVSDETVVLFRETAEGTTPAVQYWYYPGEKIGKEFIYPKDQAERIAARTGQQVRTDEGVVGPATAERADGGAQSETTAAANVEAEADARISSDAGVAAQASVDADADREVRQQPSAAAQPTAPAGSTTGNRGVTAQADGAESRDANASAPAPQVNADASVTTQQRADDAARPVGTTGAQSQDGDAGQFRGANELPRTASPLALIGLIGLLSLAGAAGIRRFYR